MASSKPASATPATSAAGTSRADARPRGVRLWEIDSLRGVAVVTMVIYHLVWDLWFFQAIPGLDPFHGFWKYFQRYTATSFILLAGLSLTLVAQRLERQGMAPGARRLHSMRRGLWVFGWGMVLTVAMWVSGVGTVDFGVLHLIGFSMIAALPFLRFGWVNIGIWLVLFLLGGWAQDVRVDTSLLIPLGIFPRGYSPVDYFPILPWFGVALLGVGVGNLLYPQGRRSFPLPDWGATFPVRLLRWVGSHSLPIYLVHQPLLFGILYLTGIARI